MRTASGIRKAKAVRTAIINRHGATDEEIVAYKKKMRRIEVVQIIIGGISLACFTIAIIFLGFAVLQREFDMLIKMFVWAVVGFATLLLIRVVPEVVR